MQSNMEQATVKTSEEIKILRQGGEILARILRELTKRAQAGVTTAQLDELAEKLIRQAGGEPSFKGFSEKKSPPFPSAICASINDEIVHAPATPARVLKDGDLLKIDIGMKWPSEVKSDSPLAEKVRRGLYTDMAVTVGVGGVSKKAKNLIAVTREALLVGFKKVRTGAKVSDIGKAVQKFVESKSFSVVRDLTGHGVGYKVHEPPSIPNFWQEGMENCELKEGMVICIEPMVNDGACQIKFAPDNWTVLTSDCSLSAHFEHTIVVTKRGGEILTK